MSIWDALNAGGGGLVLNKIFSQIQEYYFSQMEILEGLMNKLLQQFRIWLKFAMFILIKFRISSVKMRYLLNH